MKLQRRHFEFISDVIASLPNDNVGNIMKYYITQRFVMELKATNPQFNEEKFIKACGGKHGWPKAYTNNKSTA